MTLFTIQFHSALKLQCWSQDVILRPVYSSTIVYQEFVAFILWVIQVINTIVSTYIYLYFTQVIKITFRIPSILQSPEINFCRLIREMVSLGGA